MGSAETSDFQKDSHGAGIRQSEIVSEEMLGRHERRKRKVVDIGELEDCLCGSRAEPTTNNVIRCKRVGCETVWVSELTFCQDFNVKLTYIFLLNHFSIT